jgi:hypothetical protein
LQIKLIVFFILGLFLTSGQLHATSLIANHLVFSDGPILTDTLDDSISSKVFPEETSYDDYVSWVLINGGEGVGTINVSSGNFITGEWEGSTLVGDNVFSGVSGITTPNGADATPNAWSEIMLRESIFKNIILLNSDANKSYIRSYSGMSAFEPTNPDILGFNLEGGNISLSTTSDVKMTIVATSNSVGIGTTNPTETLHLKAVGARNKLRISGNLYGKMADIYGSNVYNSVLIYTGTINAADYSYIPSIIEVSMGLSTFTEVFRLPDNSGYINIPANNSIAIFATIQGTPSGAGLGSVSAAVLQFFKQDNSLQFTSSQSRMQYRETAFNSPYSPVTDSFKLIGMYKNSGDTEQKIYATISFCIDSTNTLIVFEKQNISITAFVLPTI